MSTDLSTVDPVQAYVADFRAKDGKAPSPLRDLREAALERFAERGFPTTREEAWRFTNVAPLAKTRFRPASTAVTINPHAERVSQFFLARFLLRREGKPAGHRLVFVNGRFAPGLTSVGALPPGVQVGRLASALESQRDLAFAHLGRIAPDGDVPFTALNTAFLEDGAFVFVPRGTRVEEPIHLLFLTTLVETPLVAHPRILVLLEEGSEASVIETYAGSDDGAYFVNAVTEIAVGEGASLAHMKVQQEGIQAFHTARIEARQARASRFRTSSISLGGALVRNDIGTTMEAEGCSSEFDGLYMVDRAQHVDHHTTIDHRRPHGTSRETYKGVLDERSTGVFHGKVYIRQDAQQSDAQQVNHNLLLSEEAVIHTKPQLEIFADDVKCSHGATIGRLDPQSVFYLRSRGVPAAAARDLLIYAFANELIQRIGVPPLREQLGNIVWSRFQKALEAEAAR